MAWEDVKLEYEIDINNPLKSIKEICNEVCNKIAKKEKRSIELRTVSLESSNGRIDIDVDFSLDKLLKECKVMYRVDNIGENEIYEIMKKYGTNPPNAPYIRSYVCVQQSPDKIIGFPVPPGLIFFTVAHDEIYYEIKRLNDRLIIKAPGYIERYKELYNSLRDALKRFRIRERSILADIKNKGEAEINFIAFDEEYINNIIINNLYNIFLENVKKGFTVKLSNKWKTSNKEYNRIYISYNNPRKGYYIAIEMEPPTEEKMKQLLTDMKNIGMDTKIERVSALYY